MADIQPPPTYALPIVIDEKTKVAQFNPIWLKWFIDLAAVLNEAGGTVIGDVVGPASSTNNAVARWDGTTGKVLQNSGVLVDDSNNVSGIVNLTTTGSTILGDASADTLTINAGTWTYGANWTATRAAGTLPAGGGQNILVSQITATGDAGGTSEFQGFVARTDVEGSANVVSVSGQRFVVVHEGSGVIALAKGNFLGIRVDAAGNITDARAAAAGFILTSTGNITDGSCFVAEAPTISSTGTISEHYGFHAKNLGNTAIPVTASFYAEDTSLSTTISGLLSEISAGTGKKNLNITGTADNSLAGPLYLAQDNKTQQTASAMYAGTGAPNNANGNDGDFYFRSDGGVLTTIYQRRAGAWVGVV